MKILNILKNKNITIADLARAVSKDYGYIHHIVHGKRIPSPKLANEISIALDRLISPVEILYPLGLK